MGDVFTTMGDFFTTMGDVFTTISDVFTTKELPHLVGALKLNTR